MLKFYVNKIHLKIILILPITETMWFLISIVIFILLQ